MPNTSYTISYNKQIQTLEFKHEVLPNNGYSQPLAKLFNRFGHNLANIILIKNNLAVCRVSQLGYNGIVCTYNVHYIEHVIDILFLHGKYKDYKNHHPHFLTREDFELWLNAIKNADKPAILKMLYQDNKISRAYLLKYSNQPPSLYELVKYSLIDSFFEKIDQLSLPNTIKEDIKHSF